MKAQTIVFEFEDGTEVTAVIQETFKTEKDIEKAGNVVKVTITEPRELSADYEIETIGDVYKEATKR